jgi:hypothetical protein
MLFPLVHEITPPSFFRSLASFDVRALRAQAQTRQWQEPFSLYVDMGSWNRESVESIVALSAFHEKFFGNPLREGLDRRFWALRSVAETEHLLYKHASKSFQRTGAPAFVPKKGSGQGAF